MDIDVKNIRKNLGLTQEALANKIGVDRRTIINYEKGESIPESKVKLLHFLINSESKNTIDENSTTKEPKEISLQNKGVPYYDVEFTAGVIEVENNQQTAPTSYINHPFFAGCDYVIRASGQSMAKVIAHGDAVGLIKVENWREFFPFGEIYAIVTKNDFRTIKVITKGEDNEHYTLISKPTDSKKDEFPPQQIKIDSILYLFKVQASSHLF